MTKKTARKHRSDSKSARLDRERLLTNESPFDIREAYVKLRTSMMFCMVPNENHPCRSFVFTSGKPSDGKSLTAANVAISFAMLGKNTLLIDTDMRKPVQQRLWDTHVQSGLSDFLAGIGSLNQRYVEGIPLSIIFAGTIPPNPSELLASNRMKAFAKTCADTYDYVIFDAPPINTVADAQILSSYTDGVILVARSGSTTVDELNLSAEALQRVGGNLCGVVLNDMTMKSVKYSYRYKYGDKYAYRYGYGGKYSYSDKKGDKT
ncbi:MAG: CpsD/CapB family tyrosine-protein kinase [Bilifractor sp.]